MATPHCFDWDYAGKGIPGWDPYLGLTKEQATKRDYETGDGLYDNMLSARIGQGRPIVPTGLQDDPRLPRQSLLSSRPTGPSILALLQDAEARYHRDIAVLHAEMVADWRRRRNGTWAQRIASTGEPEPTLEDARRRRKERMEGPPQEDVAWYPWYSPPPVTPGKWHEWELLEIWGEQARIRAIDEAEGRADAFMKSRYPCWGGGT